MSGHVVEDPQVPSSNSNNMFAGHDINAFNPIYNNPEQTFGSSWDFQDHTANVSRSQSATLHNASWQPNGIQQNAPISKSTITPHNQLYRRSYSNSPSVYPDPAFAQASAFRQVPTSSVVDPSLVSDYHQNQLQFGVDIPAFSNNSVTSNTTIAPQALEQRPSLAGAGNNTVGPHEYGAAKGTGPKRLILPKGNFDGRFAIIDFAALTSATQSRKLNDFVNIGDVPEEYPIGRVAIPAYAPRRSRNEYRRDSRAKLDEPPPKRGRGRPPKKPTISTSSASKVKSPKSDVSSETESTDNSSDYDSDDGLEVEAEKSPLPATRPANPLDAVRYDTMKALWLPRNVPAKAEQIKSGLVAFWEVVRTIRDRWKADAKAVTEAEASKKMSEVPFLQDRVKIQRDMMEVAVKTALDFSHPDILSHFGKNLSFVFVTYQFLLDRNKADDMNGDLARNMLKLLSRLSDLDEAALEKVHLKNVLPRYEKKGDDEIKTFIKKINETVANNKGKKPTAEITDVGASPDVKSKPDTAQPAAEVVTGVKRLRQGDANAGQPHKRVMSGSAINGAAKTLAKATVTGTKKPIPSSGDIKAGGTPATMTTVPVVKKVLSKPSGFLAGLQSASKKPGTSRAVQAAVPPTKPADVTAKIANTATEKKTLAPVAPPAPVKSTGFSFAETIANLGKPKLPEPSAKPEETGPPETEEERAKRLRKEERRKLRVTWKAGDDLVQVKLFTHDPEEELGHDASMVRDVGDVGGEGRMFKQHKDMMDIDEDEDGTGDDSLRPWYHPPGIDFSNVDHEERLRNYAPYGGGTQKPECPERETRLAYEANTLMVYYHSPADVPPTPREPSDAFTGETKPVLPFGQPSAETLQKAAAFGHQQPASAPSASAGYDLSAILGVLAQHQQQTQPQPQQPQPAPPSTAPAAFDLSALLGGQPAQPAPTPVAAQAPQQVPPTPDISALLAAIAQPQPQQQQQQQQQQPQPAEAASSNPFAQFQFPGMPAPQATQSTPDYSALLSSLAFANPAPPPQQNHSAYGQYGQGYDGGEYNTSKRSRDDYEDHGGKRGRFDNRSGKKDFGGGKKFVVPCKFWKEGKCNKGDNCTFIHG